VALPGDDAGEDGDHRQHARRQRQAEAGGEEEGEIGPEAGVAQDAGDFAAFVGVDRDRRGGGRCRRVGQRHRHRLRLRRIADAGVGAALRRYFQRQRQGARRVALDRQADGDTVVEDLDLAEILVVLLLALGEDRGAERHTLAVDGEAELVAVEVVALGDGEGDLDGLRVQRAGARLEGDGRIEEFVGVSERGEEDDEEEEAAHDHLSVSSATQFR
jgi:hypothetical protein